MSTLNPLRLQPPVQILSRPTYGWVTLFVSLHIPSSLRQGAIVALAVFFAICNALLGQYKFIVKARDNRSIGQYHGHIGSLVYVFGMITVCLGVAHVCLHMTASSLQHALGITAIVLTSLLLLLVLTEVLCLPQVEASKGISTDYPGQMDHFGLNTSDYRVSLNGR